VLLPHDWFGCAQIRVMAAGNASKPIRHFIHLYFALQNDQHISEQYASGLHATICEVARILGQTSSKTKKLLQEQKVATGDECMGSCVRGAVTQRRPFWSTLTTASGENNVETSSEPTGEPSRETSGQLSGQPNEVLSGEPNRESCGEPSG
jgi:hypothetical protein